MISKKRYWGLALPIYDCSACGTVEVIGGREELARAGGRGLGGVRGPHAASAVRRRGHDRLPGCGGPVERIRDVGNPWLDAGIVPFSTLHFREDPDYWAQWFPADFITESFPGQFRNWFYSMLAMSTVLRREPPFKTIFGYALVFGEDGRPMHKSWGNAIDFDEAAERMGVDVMRWMFAKARPEENILFGWHAADEARRELLVLWNVYAFFVTYARLAGWTPGAGEAPPVAERPRARPLDPVARRRHGGGRRGPPARRTTPSPRPGELSRFIDGLSTWYLRLSREADSRAATMRPTAPRRSRRSTRRSSPRPGCWRRSCRSWPTRCTRTSSPTVEPTAAGQRAPHALADGDLAGAPRRPPGARDGRRPGGRSTSPGRCAARPASGPASRSPGVARPARRGDRVERRPARDHRRRDQRQAGRRSSPTTPTSSSGASSRCCPRSASASGRRSRP